MGKQKIQYTVLLDSKFETLSSIVESQDSILYTQDLILKRFENQVSRIEPRVTVNLLLSGTVILFHNYRLEKMQHQSELCILKYYYFTELILPRLNL